MTDLQDRIDVIIPVYNCAEFIKEAIDSVIKQKRLAEAIIVIDDCSTDDTPCILKGFGEKIRVIRHEMNRGLPAARNTGIRAGGSELIAFLDADDAWMDEKIDRQIKAFKEHPEIGLCYTDLFDCDSKLNHVGLSRGFRKRECENVFSELFLDAFPIPPSTVIVRREVFDLCGLFDESMRKVEDYECWLRIAMQYPISCIAEPLCLRRANPNSITNTSTREKEVYYTLRAFDRCAASALKWNLQLPLDIAERKRLYFYRRVCESIRWRDPSAEMFFRDKLMESGGMGFMEKMEIALLKGKEKAKAKIKKIAF